jgi:hypothetical protein
MADVYSNYPNSNQNQRENNTMTFTNTDRLSLKKVFWRINEQVYEHVLEQVYEQGRGQIYWLINVQINPTQTKIKQEIKK